MTAGHLETYDADTATHRWRSDNRNEFRQDVRTWLTSFFSFLRRHVFNQHRQHQICLLKRCDSKTLDTLCGWNISVVRRWGFSQNFSTCGFVDSDKVIRKCYFAYLIAKSILQLKPPIEGFSILLCKTNPIGFDVSTICSIIAWRWALKSNPITSELKFKINKIFAVSKSKNISVRYLSTTIELTNSQWIFFRLANKLIKKHDLRFEH